MLADLFQLDGTLDDDSSLSFDTSEDLLDSSDEFCALDTAVSSLGSSSVSSMSRLSSSSLISSTLTSPSNTDNNASQIVTKKRKRIDTRKTRPERYVNPFGQPRILKRDVRRDYGTMFINVLNSLDRTLMLAFFERYCLPPTIRKEVDKTLNAYIPALTDQTNKPNPGMSFIQSIVHSGEWAAFDPEPMVDKMVDTTDAMPDFLVGLDHCSIQQQKDLHQSWVVCNTTFSGTVINAQKMLEANHASLCCHLQEALRGSRLTKQSSIVLHLTEDNFIYKMTLKSSGWRLKYLTNL